MAPPSGTRGRGASRAGRAGRASTRGRGGSLVTASTAAEAGSDILAPIATNESTADHALNTDAPAMPAARALTVDSSQSYTQSPTPTPAPATRGRFKPKNVRRDASERQKLEEERNRDLAAKIKIEEKEQRDADRRARRGNGRGRGRGDMTQHFTRRTVTGGGIFSGAATDATKQGGGAWPHPYGGSGGPSKGEAQPQNSHRYHDRRVNDVRVNIDSIRESVVPESGQTNTRVPNALPVGITRVEHKAEDAKVATSAELAAEEQEDDDDDLFVNGQTKSQADLEMIKDDEVWHAAPAGAKSVEVKAEIIDEDAMDVDTIPAKLKAPPSPELQKKVPAANVEDEAKARAKEKRRERALQDLELQAMALDTEALLQGLTMAVPTEGEEAEDLKEGKLFLFQFPPILPPLRDLNADGNEVVDLEQRTEVDGMRIKPDPDSLVQEPSNGALPPGGGYIGKLNVRKSGKVELDWGGQILDLGIATETDFLTSAIIVEEHESDLSLGHGKATGMGVVFGKFVATPVFDEEEDWEPDLEALGLGV